MVDASVPRRRARRRRRWVWWAVAALLLAAGGWALLRPRGPAPQRVYLETVQRTAFVRDVTGTGTVEPARSRTLVFASGGTVAEVGVEEGQRVEAGALLARLDTRALERRLASDRASLMSARADVARVAAQQGSDRRDAEAAVVAAGNQLATARQRVSDAQRQLDALQRLLQVGGASRQERDAARAALEEALRQQQQARLGLESARARLTDLDALAEAQRSGAEANAQRLATAVANEEQELAEAVLRAPFAGVVASVPFKAGDPVLSSVSTAAPGIGLVDESSISVRAAFDERRAVDLRVGQPAIITPDAAPDLELPGVVVRVDAVAGREAGGARLPVEVDFAGAGAEPLPRAAVRPGYTVTVKVVVHRIEQALVVPLEAIQRDGSGSYVYRVRQVDSGRGVAQRVAVRVLDRNATLAAVAEGGLTVGDRIAATNVGELADGNAVAFDASAGGP